MDVPRVSERTRRQLEALPPEKRARAEAAVARTQTPEARAREAVQREALEREYRQTGSVGTASGPPADLDEPDRTGPEPPVRE